MGRAERGEGRGAHCLPLLSGAFSSYSTPVYSTASRVSVATWSQDLAWKCTQLVMVSPALGLSTPLPGEMSFLVTPIVMLGTCFAVRGERQLSRGERVKWIEEESLRKPRGWAKFGCGNGWNGTAASIRTQFPLSSAKMSLVGAKMSPLFGWGYR